MNGARTRGQPAAVAAIGSMLARGLPHALLLAGPARVGKTTLAIDLAAALLCGADDPNDRPCWACRACRLVAAGNHPDLHRLVPEGPGGQIPIARVRELASALSLLPVEGGARVAIVASAQRLNEDAQNALLKTLEEPPRGVTIVLCADDEDRLLPTVHSRCARIRLGPVAIRAVESLLAEHGVADPPDAARLARLSGGRTGLALALARAPSAVRLRAEIVRGLVDLLRERPARRLVSGRELLASAAEAVTAIEAATEPADRPAAPTESASGRRRRTSGAPKPAAAQGDPGDNEAGAPSGAGEEATSPRASASDRRRAAAFLVETWTDLARDLAIASHGEFRLLRDPGLLDEVADVAGRVPPGAAATFLARLGRAGEGLEVNMSPELIVDVLVLAWPRIDVAA